MDEGWGRASNNKDMAASLQDLVRLWGLPEPSYGIELKDRDNVISFVLAYPEEKVGILLDPGRPLTTAQLQGWVLAVAMPSGEGLQKALAAIAKVIGADTGQSPASAVVQDQALSYAFNNSGASSQDSPGRCASGNAGGVEGARSEAAPPPSSTGRMHRTAPLAGVQNGTAKLQDPTNLPPKKEAPRSGLTRERTGGYEPAFDYPDEPPWCPEEEDDYWYEALEDQMDEMDWWVDCAWRQVAGLDDDPADMRQDDEHNGFFAESTERDGYWDAENQGDPYADEEEEEDWDCEW